MSDYPLPIEPGQSSLFLGTFMIEGRPCWRWPEPMCGKLQDEGVALYKRPFSYIYLIEREVPFAFRILDACRPLVMCWPNYPELREDVVQATRTMKHPELYLDAVHLTTMGGEPYANWN